MLCRHGVAIVNDPGTRCGRALCDLPQHWRLSARGREREPRPAAPPRGKHTPTPLPAAPRTLHPPDALHVHAMHSLFMAATTLCSFLALFFSPRIERHISTFMFYERSRTAVGTFFGCN